MRYLYVHMKTHIFCGVHISMYTYRYVYIYIYLAIYAVYICSNCIYIYISVIHIQKCSEFLSLISFRAKKLSLFQALSFYFFSVKMPFPFFPLKKLVECSFFILK